MGDVEVKSDWACHTQGCCLSDLVLSVHSGHENEDEETLCEGVVLLEQVEEDTPCFLTIRSTTSLPTAINRILVVSEARTMEVYDLAGEYCGTVRGTKYDYTHPDSVDRGPFYKKQLILEQPSPTCEVKLLSLAGRNSVLVSRIVVSLQSLQSCPARGPGIDMDQVQNLMEEMGTNLSPAAQHLMDMVQFQRKNQTGSLAGFLPFLMGGAGLSSLVCPSTDSTPPESSITPVDQTPPAHNLAMSTGSTFSSSSSSPDPMSDVSSYNTGSSSDAGGPMSPDQLLDVMSRLLKGSPANQGSEILPALQSVCGQVTQLRLDQAAEERKITRNASWELDTVMEQRLQDMERRLKEHLDRRLDALEQKLDKALLLVSLSHGAVGGSVGGASSSGSAEESTVVHQEAH